MAESYAIDASSLMTIGQVYEVEAQAEAWKIVVRLVEEGRIRTSQFVFDEIERNDPETFERIRQFRGQMLVGITNTLWTEAGRLANLYPIMAKVHRDRETADPWVIAIAKLDGWKVICEESAVKPQRMAWVCTQEGIPCGNIHDMLLANGMPRKQS